MHSVESWPFFTSPSHPVLSALWEVAIHGTLSVVVILPLIWPSRRRTWLIVMAAIGGVALDVDHAIAAGTVDPRAMETLAGRPVSHSLLFAAALSLLALLATRRKLVGWAVFAVLSAHLLFDAAGGGVRLLYPVDEPDSIPWLACPVGIAALTAISTLLARSGSPATRSRVTSRPAPSQPACWPETGSRDWVDPASFHRPRD
jgi:membrane-bound metal-dependent hydrolase YbcI (DUF457 family)